MRPQALLRLFALVAVSSTGCEDDGRYAAWVSFDLSLIVLTGVLSALIAAALVALVSKTRDRRHLVLGWLLAFVTTFAVVATLVAALTDHRVIVVESVFPYP